MKPDSVVSGERLAEALQAVGLRFLYGSSEDPKPLPPDSLLSALAASDEARLRLALIPLFLEHPELSAHAIEVAERLDEPARLTLQCYYTAASILVEIHQKEFTGEFEFSGLPDQFSRQLKIPAEGEADWRLKRLADRHQTLKGDATNWLGTYLHAFDVWNKARKPLSARP